MSCPLFCLDITYNITDNRRKELLFEMRNEGTIGIDAITVIVSGENVTKNVEHIERRNEQGCLYLEVNKTAKNDYVIMVILPSVIYPTNVRGFSMLDAMKLDIVTDTIRNDLRSILGLSDLSYLSVKSIEINANKEISKKANADIIVEFLARVSLNPCKNIQTILHAHGKNIYRTIKKSVIDGFKSARDSTGRFYVKCYRKDRQLGLEDKIPPTVRVELIYTKRGISQALGGNKTTLIDVLSTEAMQKLIQRYIVDVKQAILPPIRLYLNDAVDLLLNDLKAGEDAYTVFLRHYDVIKYDYKMYRVAMKKFYRCNGMLERSAQARCSHVKRKAKQRGIEVNERTIKEISELFKEIRSQQF